MALPLLVNNADCGPSNPLQGLSKRFDQDRGLQQDHFGAGRAGSSREAFRSQQSAPSGSAQEAARFFSSGPAPQLAGASAFDLSALNGSLPLAQMPLQQQSHGPAAWAADFMIQRPQQTSSNSSSQVEMQREVNVPQGQWNPMFSSYAQRPMQNFMPPMMMQQQPQRPATQHDQIQWDREFNEISQAVKEEPVTSQIPQDPQQASREADELARTAGLLLDTVGEAQNTKFAKSEFMELMRGLRDRNIVVEGNEMVQNTGQSSASGWANDFKADVKGKGRAVDPLVGGASTSFAAMTRARLAEQPQQEPLLDEDSNDAYFRQDNAEYQRYWAEANARASTSQPPATNAEWDRLQEDWDNFEATATGIQPVERYIFQPNNPYLSDRPSSTTRHHLSHNVRQPFLDSVLELEAAVQRNMTDASAWFDLGVKQQANEREKQALAALSRAVELDPSHLPAWLALAISHTNDGNREATHDAIRNWVDRNERYMDAVAQYKASHPESVTASMPERFGSLIQCLINMARSDAGNIDADIQIALAVLLNTNEDYAKAQDCFRTALAVRPDDWLLYNRVGATMANSGRAEEALQYYHKALELNPLYIRARFNLGISCINLRRFEEASHHILDALGLQESDGLSYGNDAAGSSGVTTTALWDSLRTASMHMQRPDLATFCDQRDLEAFRSNFQF